MHQKPALMGHTHTLSSKVWAVKYHGAPALTLTFLSPLKQEGWGAKGNGLEKGRHK